VHPLGEILEAAARGRFPRPDGGVTFVPELDDGTSAVVAFTAHAVVATSLTPDDLDGTGLDGYGGAMSPRALLRLAGDGTIGVIDVTLVAAGRGGGTLARTRQWDDHDRVRYARSRRSDVVVHGDGDGFVTIGAGLAGRREMSIELTAAPHGRGAGRRLIAEALALVEPDAFVFAAVAPGNARSLRAFLSQGFTPVGSEVHIDRRSSRPAPGGAS